MRINAAFFCTAYQLPQPDTIIVRNAGISRFEIPAPGTPLTLIVAASLMGTYDDLAREHTLTSYMVQPRTLISGGEYTAPIAPMVTGPHQRSDTPDLEVFRWGIVHMEILPDLEPADYIVTLRVDGGEPYRLQCLIGYREDFTPSGDEVIELLEPSAPPASGAP